MRGSLIPPSDIVVDGTNKRLHLSRTRPPYNNLAVTGSNRILLIPASDIVVDGTNESLHQIEDQASMQRCQLFHVKDFDTKNGSYWIERIKLGVLSFHPLTSSLTERRRVSITSRIRRPRSNITSKGSVTKPRTYWIENNESRVLSFRPPASSLTERMRVRITSRIRPP